MWDLKIHKNSKKRSRSNIIEKLINTIELGERSEGECSRRKGDGCIGDGSDIGIICMENNY